MKTPGVVVAVCRSEAHTFSKKLEERVRLIAGCGIEGDAHAGATVKHLSRAAKDPTQPNLRQVHLIHAELHEELRALGFKVGPGEMGENITTRGIELLRLPQGARLKMGADAVIEIKGLRNPCRQLDRLQAGLMAALLVHEAGQLVRKAGVMGVVIAGGIVQPGDPIRVELPAEPHLALDCV
jgi:MOSC domain-containing protein YiiM